MLSFNTALVLLILLCAAAQADVHADVREAAASSRSSAKKNRNTHQASILQKQAQKEKNAIKRDQDILHQAREKMKAARHTVRNVAATRNRLNARERKRGSRSLEADGKGSDSIIDGADANSNSNSNSKDSRGEGNKVNMQEEWRKATTPLTPEEEQAQLNKENSQWAKVEADVSQAQVRVCFSVSVYVFVLLFSLSHSH
jgi:hypothetical protein